MSLPPIRIRHITVEPTDAEVRAILGLLHIDPDRVSVSTPPTFAYTELTRCDD